MRVRSNKFHIDVELSENPKSCVHMICYEQNLLHCNVKSPLSDLTSMSYKSFVIGVRCIELGYIACWAE